MCFASLLSYLVSSNFILLQKFWSKADVNIMTIQLYGMCELPSCGYAKQIAIPAMWAAFNWPINIIVAQTTTVNKKKTTKITPQTTTTKSIQRKMSSIKHKTSSNRIKWPKLNWPNWNKMTNKGGLLLTKIVSYK